ncbi:hypothetical protein QC761_0031600 [Podospora bellae-mahoneyi]|uniref:Uncharacterized protein n=1 Tax=Podospora bellae-mahoneyi TaxID=2093777 RepID=A0ABR0FN10_9PEZI|nr:hypothetical protein QC761_0031600 [Podospora bellae-mahoneyi]
MFRLNNNSPNLFIFQQTIGEYRDEESFPSVPPQRAHCMMVIISDGYGNREERPVCFNHQNEVLPGTTPS